MTSAIFPSKEKGFLTKASRLSDVAVPSPCLDLRQRGEGGRVILVLNKLPDSQPAYGAGRHVDHLADPCFHKGRSNLGAVREPYGALFPPVVMGKIRPQGEYQLINGHIPAKVQGQFRLRVPVDAPALIGPRAVAVIGITAVNGVAGGKNGFAPGFHIG